MPVLLKKDESRVYSAIDMETLVTEVKDRLCIKSRERYCSSRRNAPYHVKSRPSRPCEFCYRKHYSSPDSQHESYCKSKKFGLSKPSHCLCSQGRQKPFCDKNLDLDDPHDLLQKLLAENSLIQEAVRRLQSQSAFSSTCSTRKFQPLANEDSSTCSRSKSFHPFISEDSCDQSSSSLTPLYTESEAEDDSVSEHSVDL